MKHLTIKGFPSVQSGTRMVSMVIEKAIPAEIRAMGFQLSFRYRGQPPTCFACQEVGHTARDCPKSSKRGDKGRTKPSKPAKAPATTSFNEPALSGSSKSSSPSSSHPRDLREKLARRFPPHSLSLVLILIAHCHFSRMIRWVLFLMIPVMSVHLRHARLLAIRLVLISSRCS